MLLKPTLGRTPWQAALRPVARTTARPAARTVKRAAVRPTTLLAGLCCIASASTAWAQIAPSPDPSSTPETATSHILQVGLDAWQINTSAQSDSKENMNSLSRLQLANSYPVWDYQTYAPWIRFEGGLRVGRDTLLTAKYRADQSTGSRLDELSVDWAYYAYGLKAGVLDPKISWCRTYDVDSPWARENNPFCAIQPLNFAKSSAPGAQAYANFIAGNYSVQALAGIYQPLWLGYAPNESPTLTLSAGLQVVRHGKAGLALSATNLRNGTELRIGMLRDSYATDGGVRPFTQEVQSKVLFLGASWYASAKLAVRGSFFQYDGHADHRYNDANYIDATTDRSYQASSLELNYQANAQNVYAASYSVYDFNTDSQAYQWVQGAAVLQSNTLGSPRFRTTNTALSWRREWGAGLFSVLQLSAAHTAQSDAATQKNLSSNGTSLGLRWGYRF